MNRTSNVPSFCFRWCPSIGPRGFLLAGLLAFVGGCSVEDPVARIITLDAGSGPLFIGDEAPEAEWLPDEEGALPDCAPGAPDSGVPCADVEAGGCESHGGPVRQGPCVLRK